MTWKLHTSQNMYKKSYTYIGLARTWESLCTDFTVLLCLLLQYDLIFISLVSKRKDTIMLLVIILKY